MTDDANDEDEWEYEYSTTETETFYVDLDLSSINGIIKSQNAGDRKSLKRSEASTKNNVFAKTFSRPAEAEVNDLDEIQDRNEDEDVSDEDNAEQQPENGEDHHPQSPVRAQSPQEPRLLDEDYTGRIQVLDLNSANPIVSYNGHVYSCTWHDMLGTSMFIAKHNETPFHEPEISTEDYDLIGTSRIKLVGHRARVIPKPGSRKRGRDESEDEGDGRSQPGLQSVFDGKSLGSITRTNPKTNVEIKQQASFLEQLMEIKKARGETDTVRTFADRRTVAADARQARKAKRNEEGKQREKQETAEQRMRREINELNRRVVKGDNAALERLQEIYAEMEEVENEDEDLVGDTTVPISGNIQVNTGSVDDAHLGVEGGSLDTPPRYGH